MPDPKMLREQLCTEQHRCSLDGPTAALYGYLINLCDILRPLGPDGNHDDRHTPLCGCDDVPAPAECGTGAAESVTAGTEDASSYPNLEFDLFGATPEQAETIFGILADVAYAIAPAGVEVFGSGVMNPGAARALAADPGDVPDEPEHAPGRWSISSPLPEVADVLRAQRDKAREQVKEARSWARHGYELGQRSYTWSDHGVAPAWLTEGHDPEALAGPDPHAACEAALTEARAQVDQLTTERDQALRRATKAQGWARRRARDRDDARAQVSRVRDLAESWMNAQTINRAALKAGSYMPRKTPGPQDLLNAIDEPQQDEAQVFLGFDCAKDANPVMVTRRDDGVMQLNIPDQVRQYAARAAAELRTAIASGRINHGTPHV